MPDYFITGKKGNGKTLVAVGKMKEYLERGCPVATNLDIWPENLLSHSTKEMQLYRLPDKPDADDMHLIGYGNDTPDESRNGAIFLDELGTWLNARTFSDKSRLPFIDWLLHARKYGWDVYYMVQDMCQVDKQARESLAEHVVSCRRMDRLSIPIIGALYNIFWGGKIPLPRIHVGLVRYGDGKAAMTVDTWTYRGNHLFSAYDTRQIFKDSYPSKTFSYLPPWHVKGRFKARRDWGFFVRLTKIHLRRFNRYAVGLSSFLVGVLTVLSFLVYSGQSVQAVTDPEPSEVKPLAISSYGLKSVSRFPSQPVSFVLENADGDQLTSKQLLADGYSFSVHGRESVTLSKGGQNVEIYF